MAPPLKQVQPKGRKTRCSATHDPSCAEHGCDPDTTVVGRETIGRAVAVFYFGRLVRDRTAFGAHRDPVASPLQIWTGHSRGRPIASSTKVGHADHGRRTRHRQRGVYSLAILQFANNRVIGVRPGGVWTDRSAR